jgi:hypothetical protein
VGLLLFGGYILWSKTHNKTSHPVADGS